LVRRKIDVAFEDLGETRVKNLVDTKRVFRIALPSARTGNVSAADGEPHKGSAPQSDKRKSGNAGERKRPGIAILPFDNLSGDPEQTYFCDGLTHDLTTDLSRFHELFVIAANSAFAYKSLPRRVQEIGSELGVEYLLEGSGSLGARAVTAPLAAFTGELGGSCHGPQ
jgi:adenylate cyclase